MYLQNCIVYVTTKNKPAILDKSADGAGFHPSVYGQTASLVWYFIYSPEPIDGLVSIFIDASYSIR